MARWILGLLIFLVVALGGILLLALLLWWLLRQRKNQVASTAIEIDTAPVTAEDRLQPAAVAGQAEPAQAAPPAVVEEQPSVSPQAAAAEPVTATIAVDDDLVTARRDRDEATPSSVQGDRFAPLAMTGTGAAPAADDLKRIEGIGPKISSVLQAAGIRTFEQLSKAEVGQVRLILEQADPRLLRLADPGSWPEQARLAALGQWADLEELQGKLKGGRSGK
jgi:predicted flap endonuclease-1-like 5' DNA nuclease